MDWVVSADYICYVYANIPSGIASFANTKCVCDWLGCIVFLLNSKFNVFRGRPRKSSRRWKYSTTFCRWKLTKRRRNRPGCDRGWWAKQLSVPFIFWPICHLKVFCNSRAPQFCQRWAKILHNQKSVNICIKFNAKIINWFHSQVRIRHQAWATSHQLRMVIR